ncbi:FtsK/SpoIIIE domain-containing protein [Fodinicola feengrottensis]|uniref:FtsK/SpoIIIE domain-containing protein n=1 Tax=Fodinicola feengrottensis TaxID=435914 RepID=A0ABN2HM69_9ACTN
MIGRVGKAVRKSPQEMTLVTPKKYPLGVALLLWLGVLVGRLLLLAGRHPMVTFVLVTAGALWFRVHWSAAVAYVAVLVLVFSGWRWKWPQAFRTWVGVPARSAWRREVIYRRHWQPAMVLSGLSNDFGHMEYLPVLRRVISDNACDLVRVSMIYGQTPGDFEAAAEALAHVFKAASCRVVVNGPQELTLIFIRRDVLAAPIPALDIPNPPNLAALPIGHREQYAPPTRIASAKTLVRKGLRRPDVVEVGTGQAGRSAWLLRLIGTHILITGATGAGKGSVLWSLIRSLDAAIRARMVEIWAIDPKGGMELAFGARMFARFCYGSDREQDTDKKRSYELAYAEFLEDAVTELRARQERLRGFSRLHVPVPGDPLIVILIDELASLSAYIVDRDAKTRIAKALSLILSQGRAVGVLVVAAVQDPRKETVPFRDLFPTRIALRLTDAEQVDLVLGKGARDRGALCDLLPESTPGVGYVVLEGVREPVRVRAGYPTDADIREMAQFHGTDRSTVAFDEAA